MSGHPIIISIVAALLGLPILVVAAFLIRKAHTRFGLPALILSFIVLMSAQLFLIGWYLFGKTFFGLAEHRAIRAVAVLVAVTWLYSFLLPIRPKSHTPSWKVRKPPPPRRFILFGPRLSKLPSKTVDNERRKLLAAALDRISTACMTVGVATPTAAYMLNLGGVADSVEPGRLLSAFAIWMLMAVVFHLFARHQLGGLRE